jgi:hypothetical protein
MGGRAGWAAKRRLATPEGANPNATASQGSSKAQKKKSKEAGGAGASSSAGGSSKAPADVGSGATSSAATTGEGGGSSKGPAAIAPEAWGVWGPWGARAKKMRGKKQYYISVILKPDVPYARRVAFGMGLHDRVNT